jgi:iron-sulfur cluster assembly accessory protein
MSTKITSEMTVAEIFELAPDSVVVMENAGLKCTGCDARTDRALSDLAKGLDSSKMEKLLIHLNKLKQIDISLELPEENDFELEEIQEGNKKYYRLAGMLFTENAYKNLHELANKKGLQIKLQTGGCSGFKYDFDYFDQAQNKEREYKLSDGLSVFMDDFTFSKSKGAVLDFTISLHSSGLNIQNPNRKRACSCGTSISF